MRSFQAFVFSVLICGIGLHSARAQGAMVEVVPLSASIGFVAIVQPPPLFDPNDPDENLEPIPPGWVFPIAARFVAAKRLSNKVYLGGQLEFGGGAFPRGHSNLPIALFVRVGPLVNYYPWGQGTFTTWRDKLHFIGSLHYRYEFFWEHTLNPQIGVGYDLRMGKRKGFAITPELAYNSFYSFGYGSAHMLRLNIRWKLFTGKARQPKPQTE